MPSSTSILLSGEGPMQGYGMPYGGMYTNVYGVAPGAQTAENQYWDTLNRGYQNQQDQLVRDAFSATDADKMRPYDWRSGIAYDPQTGNLTFDRSRIVNPTGAKISDQDFANMEKRFQSEMADTNEDRVQARQQMTGLAQQQLAQKARTEQQANERAGFQQELARYKSPNIMNQMVNPQMQAAMQQGMAGANAAGMAGGSMAQAANRRANMQGLGQAFSSAVPQAAVAQAGQDFNWQKAREGMINNYYQQQNQRAQQDIANQMNQTAFQKGLEEYEHNRSNETLQALSAFGQNVGAAAATVSPMFKSGNQGG